MSEYRAIITVMPPDNKRLDYAPINFAVAISEALASLLMATPIGAVSIGIELKGQTLDKSRLLDFK